MARPNPPKPYRRLFQAIVDDPAANGPALTIFITKNAALLSEVAATYGGTFFNWFAAIMGPVFLALGVKDALNTTKT